MSSSNPHLSTQARQGQGVFISFEGIDGAGKSTHIPALVKAFEQAGKVCCQTREPGGTPLAESLRDLLLHQTMTPLTEALLMFAARQEHVQQVLLPALNQGQVVLCDRFTDASFAYQGAGRGFSWSTLETLEQWVQLQGDQSLLQPHLTFWFDLDPALAAQRLQQARSPDKFEAQSLEFFTRVRAGYKQRMQAQPERFARIDAAQTQQQVWQAVLQEMLVRQWLPPSVLDGVRESCAGLR